MSTWALFTNIHVYIIWKNGLTDRLTDNKVKKYVLEYRIKDY